MSHFQTLIESPLAASLGSALIHFVWQGTLIAFLLALAFRCLRHRSSNLRYAIACGALLLMLALPLSRIALTSPTSPEARETISVPVPADRAGETLILKLRIPLSTTAEMADRLKSGLSLRSLNLTPLLPWLTLLWSLGVIGCSLRLVGGWLYARRLATHGTRQLDDAWQERLWVLGRQLKLTRPIRLLESALVAVPTAIGWLRPVILLPVSALAGLTPRQLEGVLAHELAHIRRHDYLVNLLQAMVETLLFYHPAVWWVSRQIRNEREICCDDLAVEMCGDALLYARALLELEQLRAARTQLAMAANGGVLMNRIQRLIAMQPSHTDRFAGLFAGLLVVITVVCAGVGAQIALPSSPRQAHLQRAVIPEEDSAAKERASDRELVARPKRSPAVASAIATSLVAATAAAESTEPQPASQSSSSKSAMAIAALSSANPTDRAAAACQLGKMRAIEAIPALIDLLSDETVIEPMQCWEGGDWNPAKDTLRHPTPGEQAAIALAYFGDPSVEPLITALGSASSSTRSNAAWAIGELHGVSTLDRHAAVEPLIVALADADPWVRVAAAFSLGELRPRAAVDPLIAALLDADRNVREMAASALGELKAHAAVDGLTTILLRDESERVRRKAAYSLGEIKNAAALEALSAALTDSDHWVRSNAKRAIKEIRD